MFLNATFSTAEAIAMDRQEICSASWVYMGKSAVLHTTESSEEDVVSFISAKFLAPLSAAKESQNGLFAHWGFSELHAFLSVPHRKVSAIDVRQSKCILEFRALLKLLMK